MTKTRIFVCICIGGVFLLIHRMTATFGQLQGARPGAAGGLNILQAPNESGKSTWCAFLASMLYGINSRERDRAGFHRRQEPLCSLVRCRYERADGLRHGAGELTLTRTTRRQTSPMGEFSAVYAGTGDPVPDLTGRTCGETLLGVSREVFERSAFIRQSGLAVTQDAGLERRIAALISSGEEDTSYSEAAEALKKQLNRRRHNKTGLLPSLEAALAETQRQSDGDGRWKSGWPRPGPRRNALARRLRWPRSWRSRPLGGRPAAAGSDQAEAAAQKAEERAPLCGDGQRKSACRKTTPSAASGAPS